MHACTSITTLLESIRCLSSFKILNLNYCRKLQKLSNSISQLTMLDMLYLGRCESLEALPAFITTFSQLTSLYLDCSFLLILSTTLGLLTIQLEQNIDLAPEHQVIDIGQLNTFKKLKVMKYIDKVITLLNNLGALSNLHQLCFFGFEQCQFMTKIPQTIGLLTNLDHLSLWHCKKVQELPNSIGQFKMLIVLFLRYCNCLETRPHLLGALTSLKNLSLVNCTAITKLPTSIGHCQALRNCTYGATLYCILSIY